MRPGLSAICYYLALIVASFLGGAFQSVEARGIEFAPNVSYNCTADDLTGDNPLTPTLFWEGHGGVRVVPLAIDGVANPSGSLTVDSIPEGSSIVYASFGTTSWQGSLTSSSCTINGIQYNSVPPSACDEAGGLFLSLYKWNVAGQITGNGTYSFTTASLSVHTYGVFLVVVYENPASPMVRIVVNDGSEGLAYSSTTTSFYGFAAGTGELRIFTEAGDANSSGNEAIIFNGQTLAGPGDIFCASLGAHADYFDLPVTNVSPFSNDLILRTGNDWIGIHLAILIGSIPSNSFEISMVPLTPPIFIPANGGSFDYTASVQRAFGSQTPFYVWARDRYPDGTYTGPLLGPVQINPPVGVTVSRQRTQVIPSTYPAGVHYYIGYAHTTVSYPATDADSFSWTKEGSRVWGLGASEAVCYGEPFPGEEIPQQAVGHPPEESPPLKREAWGDLFTVSPSPFNASTAISYELRAASHVSLKVYNVSGGLVWTGVDCVDEAGLHQVTFNGSKLAAGVYLVKLEVSGSGPAGGLRSTTPTTEVRKIVLLK